MGCARLFQPMYGEANMGHPSRTIRSGNEEQIRGPHAHYRPAFHWSEAFMGAECYDPSVSESFHLRRRRLSDPTKGFPANYSDCDYRRCFSGCIVVKP